MFGCEDQNYTELFLIGVKIAGITGAEIRRAKRSSRKTELERRLQK